MNIEIPQISIWDVLNQKIKQIIPIINLVKMQFKNMFIDSKPNAELELLNIKISKVKAKLYNAKMKMNYKGVLEAEVELEKLNKKKQELEKGNKGNFFSSFLSSLKKVTPSMKNVDGITVKIKNTIKQWSDGLKNGLGHVLKYAGALFSLKGIYSTLSSSASSWLSSQNAGAKQLSANIDYLKYSMGSVFAPIIQYVTNLVYSLMKAVQSLVYAFSGVNIFAKATAKSMNSASGSASKASKSLAGIHNEINNVSDNSSSGGSGSTSPNVDLSQMDNAPNRIIDAIKNGNWYEVGEIIGQKLNETMEKISSFIKTFDFSNLGKSITTLLSSSIRSIDWKILGNILSSGIKGIFDSITSFFETFDWNIVINGLLDFITGFDWNGVVEAIFKELGSACANLINLGMIIGEKINEALDKANDFFQEKIEECGGNVVLGILKGIGDAVIGIGEWIIEHIFNPFIEGFKSAFGIHSPSTVMEEQGKFIIEGLKNGLLGIWDEVKQPFIDFKDNLTNKLTEIKINISSWSSNTKTIISNWGNNIKSKISESWSNASNTVKEKVHNLKNSISTGLSNAKMTISNWGNNVKNKFTNLGEDAKTWGKDLVENMASGIRNNMQKVGSAVQGVANKIKGLLGFSEPEEGPLSNFHTYMPDMIDLMVNGIRTNTNKVKEEIENLAGTMSYTINTETIAGINPVNSNGETIKVRPQTTLNTLEDVLSDFNSNNGQPLHITIQYLGKEIFDDTIDYINSKTRRTGKNTIVTVGD